MCTYTDEYKKGQFFTPEDLAAKMIAAVPDDLWESLFLNLAVEMEI